MKKSILYQAIGGALLGLFGTGAFGAEVLPMSYDQNFGLRFDPAGSVVLPGARASIVDGVATATPVPVLYVAPTNASVTRATKQVNNAANCSVIKNDLYIEEAAVQAAAEDIKDSEEARNLLRSLRSDRLKLVKLCIDARTAKRPDAAAICASRVENDDLIKELEAEILPAVARYESAADKAIGRLATYGSDIGGYAAAIVQLYDQSELNRVKQANPGFEVRMVPMTGITFGFNAGEEASPRLKAGRRTALSFYLNGVGDSDAWQGQGGSPQAITKLLTGKSASLGILLSRLGACEPALVRTGTFDYWYDGYGLLDGKVSYNKWKFYTKIEEATKSGGFFTTSTAHHAEENLQNTEDFKVAAVGHGQGAQEADVAAMEERLATRLEAKLLRQMAEKTDSVTHAEVPPPGADGASTAADGLLKCPNGYCQVAGYALKTLDAIFGEATSRDSVQKQWDWIQREEWSQTTVTPYPGSSSALVEWLN